MTTLTRRTFLKGSCAGGALALTAAVGLLRPARVLAATWPAAAFEATTAQQALQSLYGTTQIPMDSRIHIRAPIQAENGAVVPIEVSTSLPKVESIAIVVDKNPSPLVTQVRFLNGAQGFFMARMKMGQTSPVRVIVKSDGHLYQATQSIKVTVGGCGG
ncbi:MAG: thiosulfate oxidation carrier protein SoxY [Acidiferrobacterales bacterium]